TFVAMAGLPERPDASDDALSAAATGLSWSDDAPSQPDPIDRIVDPGATVPFPVARVGQGAVATAGAPPPVVDPAGPGDPDGPDGPDREDGRRRHRRWPWVVLVLALLAGGGGTAAAMALRDDGPVTPARKVVLPVPELEGRSQATAESVAEAGGWRTTVVTERRDGTIKGTVLATEPSAGIRLAAGQPIELTVSAGQTEVAVPTDLAGRTLADATAQLEAIGLEASTKETRYDEDIEDGAVIGVAGGTPAKLEKGLAVPLVVSQGPEPRIVPGGLVGGTEEAAKAKITDLQLQPAVVRSYSDTAPEGTVISQLPKPGEQLGRGGTVTIEVSRGPKLVAVPNVRGAQTQAEANAIIRAAGLVPGNVSGPSEGTPQRTSPTAGTMVKPGSKVDIVLG
ncbi:MAG: protein kinase, partial [Acidimicrobiales bacterium]|nr:protein kinase [Acidimicrobiales bacterium]